MRPPSADVSHAGVAAPFLAEALLPLLPELERAFATVARRPRVHVRQEMAEDPAHLVRRSSRALMTRIAQRPALREQPGATLPHPRTADSLDHPANAYVGWLMKRVARVLQDTADVLRAGNDESEAAVRCRLRGEACARGARRLTAILRRSALRDVEMRPLEESALLTVRDDPGYARMHRLGRRFLSPLFRLTPGPLPSPAPPSYELYELWTFLRLWSAISEALGDEWRWDVSILDDPASFARVGEGTGVTARNATGDEVRVVFNPTFACHLVDPSGDRIGLTGERRPDVVVTYRRAGAATGAWVALDAKYRVGREALAEEFATAHVYRDALRWASFGGQCRACLLLAPAEVPECAPWFSDEFRTTHGFGVAVLTPGEHEAVSRVARWTLDRLGVAP